MKKIAAFAVCLLVLAAVVRGLTGGAGFGPTILTVAVTLPDGTDITDDVRLLVGGSSGDDPKPVTLGNMRVVKPMDRDHRYEIPFDRETAVFVFVEGMPPVQFTVRLAGGEERFETFVLESGTVIVAMQRSEGLNASRIIHKAIDGQHLGELVVTTPRRLVLPAGTHRFRASGGEETVVVTSGGTHNVTLNDMQGRVDFEVSSVVPWADDFPRVWFEPVVDGQRENWQPPGAAVGFLPFATYEMAPYLTQPWALRPHQLLGEVQTVTIDDALVSVTVPLSVQVVLPEFAAWDMADLEIVDAVLFSMTERGGPLAVRRVDEDRTPLVIIAQDPGAEYAVALMKRKRVIALQQIGQIPLDNPKPVQIGLGGDYDLCFAVAIGMDCDSLRP